MLLGREGVGVTVQVLYFWVWVFMFLELGGFSFWEFEVFLLYGFLGFRFLGVEGVFGRREGSWFGFVCWPSLRQKTIGLDQK